MQIKQYVPSLVEQYFKDCEFFANVWFCHVCGSVYASHVKVKCCNHPDPEFLKPETARLASLGWKLTYPDMN